MQPGMRKTIAIAHFRVTPEHSTGGGERRDGDWAGRADSRQLCEGRPAGPGARLQLALTTDMLTTARTARRHLDLQAVRTSEGVGRRCRALPGEGRQGGRMGSVGAADDGRRTGGADVETDNSSTVGAEQARVVIGLSAIAPCACGCVFVSCDILL